MCITFFPNVCLRRDGAKRVRLIWIEIYVQIRTSLGVKLPAVTGHWHLLVLAILLRDKLQISVIQISKNVAAMCDKWVSTNRLVITTQPVFNRLPSTDECELRNARQVKHVLGLHLDYVANCLPNTVVWCPSQRWKLQRKVLCSGKSVQLQYFCKLNIWQGEHVAERSVKNPTSTASY